MKQKTIASLLSIFTVLAFTLPGAVFAAELSFLKDSFELNYPSEKLPTSTEVQISGSIKNETNKDRKAEVVAYLNDLEIATVSVTVVAGDTLPIIIPWETPETEGEGRLTLEMITTAS